MRDGRQFPTSLIALAGNDTAERCSARRDSPRCAASIEELAEAVRDLSRRVAMVEVEMAGRRIMAEVED